ncbi:hypothetical protein [Clostridium weizhouense]|uniref:Membrane-spanning protein n=1 Tax=Clostridium weizhouense TaxID=2859781 RepID=A0ABS7AIZ3_9CLOT|nr:hypothetical protein [Clostridium weizhouense]MBW6408620.1 hypothetical protein [Clostridium weizhouense]
MKKKMTYDHIITILVVIYLIIHLIYNILFQSGNKLWNISLIFIAIIAMKFIFSFTFMKKSKIMYMLGLIFIVMSIYLGNVLNIYTFISQYDKILHFVSGIILSVFGFSIYIYFEHKEQNKLNYKFAIIFTLMFSIAMAGIWEIWEFSTDQIFGLTSQHNSLFDTMMDIICGTIGGCLILPLVYIHIKNKKIKFLEVIIKEITE